MKKYQLTSETITITNHPLYFSKITLHRIQALRDFADVKTGDLGGFVEDETNLSQEGDCWVYDDAKVYGDACVTDDAQVRDNAEVYEDACIAKKSTVTDNAEVSGHAIVTDDAVVCDDAVVTDSAIVCEYARIYADYREGRGRAEKNAIIFGDARVDYTVVDFACDDDLEQGFEDDEQAELDTLEYFGVEELCHIDESESNDAIINEYVDESELQKKADEYYNEDGSDIDNFLAEIGEYYRTRSKVIKDDNFEKYVSGLRKKINERFEK